MILTVTLNPAIDKIVLLDDFSVHKLHRLKDHKHNLTFGGGKGVNIALDLKALNNNVVACGIAAGYSGHMLTDCLRSKGISTTFIFSEGNTRTNIAILDRTNETLTEINELGPEVAMEDLEFFMQTYIRLLKQVSWVVVGGSLPSGVPPDYYSKLVYYANKANVPIIMHVASTYLESIMSEKPFAIIPDLRSKHVLHGKPVNVVMALHELGMEMIRENKHLQYVIFENRIENVVAVNRKKAWVARPKDVRIVNMLGYADAYVAGFVHALEHKFSEHQLLVFASACGLTNVEQVKKDLDNINSIENNFHRIELEEL